MWLPGFKPVFAAVTAGATLGPSPCSAGVAYSACRLTAIPSIAFTSPHIVPKYSPPCSLGGMATATARAPRSAPVLHPPESLANIIGPAQVAALSSPQLKRLCGECRNFLIDTLSTTGGHFGANLGIVELSVALVHAFNLASDAIIYDVGHQGYVHKLLTGRKALFGTLRQKNGLSGFLHRGESRYDPFGAGHASTALSAAQGMAEAMRWSPEAKRESGQGIRRFSEIPWCIAVVGDGSMTGGMAFEAMNLIGDLRSKVLTIYNDNGQISLPTGIGTRGGIGPVGALSRHFDHRAPLESIPDGANATEKLIGSICGKDGFRWAGRRVADDTRPDARNFFECLGHPYLGPFDGHDVEGLSRLFKAIKRSDMNGPLVVHVRTSKGKGYGPATSASDKMHGVVKFNTDTGNQSKGKIWGLPEVMGRTLCRISDFDADVLSVSAAMLSGTGLDIMAKKHPYRVIDVGIAEQHAVTMCGGMATKGKKPFCAIYSTFLQRGWDQIVHDIAIQKLPVRFLVGGAGPVGPDGATHQGQWDIGYLSAIPNMVVMAPSDEMELINMMQTAYERDDGPTAIRYPKEQCHGPNTLKNTLGHTEIHKYIASIDPQIIQNNPNGYVLDLIEKRDSLRIGEGRMVHGSLPHILPTTDPKSTSELPIPSPVTSSTTSAFGRIKIGILSLGTRLRDAVEAARETEARYADLGVPVEIVVADARFARPLDTDLINRMVHGCEYVITIEEGGRMGFGSMVGQYISNSGILASQVKKPTTINHMTMPDVFIEHATRAQQLAQSNLDKPAICNMLQKYIYSHKLGDRH